MSTIPEVVVGASCGMRIMALSMITNIARPDAPEKVDAEDVVEIAARSEPNLRKIVMAALEELSQ
jgi:purine-nucleoside phosphorylase